MLFKTIIAASIFLLAACEPISNNNGNNSNNNGGKGGNNGNNSNNNGGKGGNTDPVKLSYKGKKLILTKHAMCRMDCRYIDESEIMDIIADNNINARKSTSTAENGKCPTTAYEGVSDDKQSLRIIVAYCEGDEVARVVTVIDTKSDIACVCD